MQYEMIQLHTEDAESEREVLEEYVIDAVTRVPEQQFCDVMSFVRMGTDPQRNTGGIGLSFQGDAEQLVAHERETWERLVKEGLLTDWERAEHPWNKIGVPEQSAELGHRLHSLAARMSVVVYEEFDRPPAAVDEYPDEDTPSPTGWWVVLHMLTNHQGYSPDEEIRASMQNIKNHLHYAAEKGDHSKADEKIDELIQQLEEIREETKTPRWKLD